MRVQPLAPPGICSAARNDSGRGIVLSTRKTVEGLDALKTVHARLEEAHHVIGTASTVLGLNVELARRALHQENPAGSATERIDGHLLKIEGAIDRLRSFTRVLRIWHAKPVEGAPAFTAWNSWEAQIARGDSIAQILSALANEDLIELLVHAPADHARERDFIIAETRQRIVQRGAMYLAHAVTDDLLHVQQVVKRSVMAAADHGDQDTHHADNLIREAALEHLEAAETIAAIGEADLMVVRSGPSARSRMAAIASITARNLAEATRTLIATRAKIVEVRAVRRHVHPRSRAWGDAEGVVSRCG